MKLEKKNKGLSKICLGNFKKQENSNNVENQKTTMKKREIG